MLVIGVYTDIKIDWEVSDAGAVLFAEELYQHLLAKETIGDALLQARRKLYERRPSFGKLWAAYQHYGDPMARLREG